MSTLFRYSILRLAVTAALIGLGASIAAAQDSPAARPAAAVAAASAASVTAAEATDGTGFDRVLLTAGRSTVLATSFDVTRIAVTNPAVADAVVVQPREVLIDGKSAGTVSLIVWGTDQRRQDRRRR